jgi:5-formyltetrahydrofolate cyclo-ligase
MISRRRLRAEMRARRRAISSHERARLATALARHLGQWLRLLGARRVACYLPNDAEMDPGPIVERLRSNGTRVLLPALHNDALWFLPYERNTRLAPNRFGIPEPDVTPRKRCRARDLDLVLMPLVAFDDAGNRLGMGGGFYDRTFSYLKYRSYWKKPLLIGIAYELQRLDSLPAQPWDVPLRGVATEKRLYLFPGRR